MKLSSASIYPAEDESDDPLCQLIPRDLKYNQKLRICVKALGSSYFEGKLKNYRDALIKDQCYRRKISFQTEYGKEAARSSYYDWIIDCDATDLRSNSGAIFYVSRAYNSNHVFVYTLSGENLYLETLATNMTIIDKPTHTSHP